MQQSGAQAQQGSGNGGGLPPPLGGGYTPPAAYVQQYYSQQALAEELTKFWAQMQAETEDHSEALGDFKNQALPLARIKKIMKSDEDVRMISAEAPVLFARACEFFIQELTTRSWAAAQEFKRRTMQRSDVATAISRTDIFDFLVDIVPREEANEPAGTNGGGGGGAGGGLAQDGMGSGHLQGPAPTGMQTGQQQAAATAPGMGMFQPQQAPPQQQAQQFMPPTGQPQQQQQYLVPSGQPQQQPPQQQFMPMPQGQQRGGGSNQGSGSAGGAVMFNPYMPTFSGFAQQPGMQMQGMQFPQQQGSGAMQGMQQQQQPGGGPSLQ